MNNYFGLKEMDLTMQDIRMVILSNESFSYGFSFYNESGFSSSTTVFYLSRSQVQSILAEVQGLLICIEKDEVCPSYKKITLCFDKDFESYVVSVVEETKSIVGGC